MKKRILSLIMVIAMVLSFVPAFEITASAVPAGNPLPVAGGQLEGTYYLDDDTALTSSVSVESGKSLTIDLNGHVLKGTGSGYTSVITNYSGGTLTIIDSTPTAEHKYVVDATGLWNWDDTAEGGTAFESLTARPEENDVIIVKGGAITGGDSTTGGAIMNNGTLNINAGNLIGNRCKVMGGAIFQPTGTTTLSDCKLLGNVSDLMGGAISVAGGSILNIEDGAYLSFNACGQQGGGVDANSGCTVNMNGGAISYNLKKASTCNGGGVSSAATFIMNGGEISHNIARRQENKEKQFTGGSGGGIYNTKIFIMKSGTLSDNYSESNGGGISSNYADNDTPSVIEITGGTIKNNTAENVGGGISTRSGSDSYTDCSITGNKASKGGGVYIGDDALSTSPTIGGTVKITANTLLDGETANNLYLNNKATVTIDGDHPLTNESVIGVNTETAPTAGNPVAITSNGTAKDLSRFTADDHTNMVKFADEAGTVAAHLELVYSPCSYSVPLTAGDAQTLILGDTEAGEYKITGNTVKGFQLSKNSKFVSVVNGKVKADATGEYSWEYDGGLYTEVKTTVVTRTLFWSKTSVKTVKQYLTYNNGNFGLSSVKSCAEVLYTDPNGHCIAYKHDGDGKHVAYCTKCDYIEEAEAHEYDDETHLCKCGKYDPDACGVTTVKVNKTVIKTYVGLLFWKRAVYSYQYTVKPTLNRATVKSIWVSADGENWKCGSIFTSNLPYPELYIKITDNLGHETKWKYENGTVKNMDVQCDVCKIMEQMNDLWLEVYEANSIDELKNLTKNEFDQNFADNFTNNAENVQRYLTLIEQMSKIENFDSKWSDVLYYVKNGQVSTSDPGEEDFTYYVYTCVEHGGSYLGANVS